jgi:hypothetical protein
MTNPRIYLIRMVLFVLVVALLAAAFAPEVSHAFMSSAGLNGLILGILIFGIIFICRQVFLLTREVSWIESFRTGRPGVSTQATPRLLASMATMLGERKAKLSLSAVSMRTLLDGIAARLDESRETARYMIGLLIFLGLLGTFWGLMETVRSISIVIAGLSVPTGDIGSMFEEFKRALEKPLGGMGFAFSSSLFGLAGSLVLGFLELQATQAQNRFYNDLEDWLSGQTRLSSGALMGEGEQAVPVYVQALLEQTADSLENLQRTIERGEESRIHANQSISTLGDRLGALTDQMRTEQNLMLRLAETQMELKPIFAKIADQLNQGGLRHDDGLRSHLRNIDVQFSRLLEELSTGRSEMTQELRSEIRVLSRTLAALAERASR